MNFLSVLIFAIIVLMVFKTNPKQYTSSSGASIFKPGGFLSGQTFIIDDKCLKFSGSYKGALIIPRSQIETITITPVLAGLSEMRLIGNGTILAKIKLPHSWAEKTQRWITEKLNLA